MFVLVLICRGDEVIDRNIVVSCIKSFNGEYSIQGIAKVLTGYNGFKFIPKLKKSQFYGILKDEKFEEVMNILAELLNEGLIIEKDNHKVFTTSLLKNISDQTTEYIKPEFSSHKTPVFTKTEDLLSVVYGADAKSKESEESQKNNTVEEYAKYELSLDDTTIKVIEYIKQGKNLFITGGAGTGKSYLLNQLSLYYRNKLQITSTTGISALNVSGQTIHSWAGIGIANKPIDDVVKSIKKKPTLLKQILMAELLAIDEISMLDNDTMDYINDVLKLVRKDKKPFGGIQVLIFGDFFQLPPVGLKEEDNIDFCFNSKSWKELNLTTILLESVKRQSDTAFVNALNNVREDKTSNEDLKVFFKCDYDADYEPSRDILQIFSTNNSADAYNSQCYNELDTEPFQYISEDELYVYDNYNEGKVINLNIPSQIQTLSEYDKKCIERFNEDCKAPQLLELKVGCRVMLVKNQNIKAGLVNGACGTVKNLTDNSITVLYDNGVTTNVVRETFEYIKEGKTKVKRLQYPLRLAYGITIHKSQGMTFDRLVVNFNRIFDYGQAYVALSRTRGMDGLIIKGFDPNKIKANPKVIEFYKNLDCVRM